MTIRFSTQAPRIPVDSELLLRPWSPADAEQLYRACLDPEIVRWTSVPSTYSLEEAQAFIELTESRWSSGTGGALALSRGEEVLGSFSIVAVYPEHSSVEIGYWVAPWGRGRGYGALALDALRRYVETVPGVAGTELRIHADNEASQALARRGGYVLAERDVLSERSGVILDIYRYQPEEGESALVPA